jgi:threonine/homoserine/homoserine lactone efflux protein
MPELSQLLIFMAAGWLLNLTPGPDVLYIVTQALRLGVRAGVLAGLGITAGCFVHIGAAAVGVGALLATSSAAFAVLKYLGAAYLLWMGARLLLARAPAADLNGGPPSDPKAAPGSPWLAGQLQAPAASGREVFMGGFWTNVLNPKVAIFFLAFVPQFIVPGTDNKALVFVLLGVLFNLNAIPVNIGWALAAVWMARRVTAVQRSLFWLDKLAGAMFAGFGLKLALSDNPS